MRERAAAVILAFDYGEQRIGVAVGEMWTASSRPLTTVRTRRGGPDWSEIRRIIDDYAPDRLVVGLPMHMDGSPCPMTDAAAKFSRQLAGRFALPVELHDERLTSWEANAHRQSADPNHMGGVDPVKVQGRRRPMARRIIHRVRHLDPQAAQLILDSWLNEHRG